MGGLCSVPTPRTDKRATRLMQCFRSISIGGARACIWASSGVVRHEADGARTRSSVNWRLEARARCRPCPPSPPSFDSLTMDPKERQAVLLERINNNLVRSALRICSESQQLTPPLPDEDDRAHERGEPLHRGPLPRQQGHPRGRVDDGQVPEERAVQHRARRRLGLDRARGVLYGRRGAVLYRVRRRWLLRSARPARAAPPARSSRSRSASSQGRGGPP
jgi:hypothetical protein